MERNTLSTKDRRYHLLCNFDCSSSTVRWEHSEFVHNLNSTRYPDSSKLIRNSNHSLAQAIVPVNQHPQLWYISYNVVHIQRQRHPNKICLELGISQAFFTCYVNNSPHHPHPRYRICPGCARIPDACTYQHICTYMYLLMK